MVNSMQLMWRQPVEEERARARHSRKTHATVVMLALGAAALALSAVPARGQVMRFVSPWTIQATTDPANGSDSILRAASAKEGVTWGVGDYEDDSGLRETLVEFNDGSGWVIQPSLDPSDAGDGNLLNAVTATSSANAWAVGFAGANGPLIEHYNGTSWHLQTAPRPADTSQWELFGVGADSPSSAWAVGVDTTIGCGLLCGAQTLIEHYNGTSWAVEHSPSPRDWSYLQAVTVPGNSRAWAVGYGFDSSSLTTLILRWNGIRWRTQASPSPGVNPELLGVSATKRSNVWAVGYTYYPQEGVKRTLVLHYDGSSWKRARSPNRGTHDNYLTAVKTTSASNAWAVGYSLTPDGATKTLVEHYDGTRWRIQASPNDRTLDDTLIGIGAANASNATAVGSDGSGGTFAIHCCS